MTSLRRFPFALVCSSILLTLACGGGSNSFTNGGSGSSGGSGGGGGPVGQGMTKLSTDTYTNSTSQHATEVEPHAIANGTTIVSAFQVGRIFSGGGADIGFATTTNGGSSWTAGNLPGITIFQGGNATAVSDPVVAFDASHNVWLISHLPITTPTHIAVSRSLDGLNWGAPITISTTPNADKNWTSCDNTPTSQFFGHCYTVWDDPDNNGRIWLSTSTDGGMTWSPAVNTADLASGIGEQPMIQPNGNVVVPYLDWSSTHLNAFMSTDGGAHWSASTQISTVTDHQVAANLRNLPMPSTATDAGGTLYVVWPDCRFRIGCSSNDLVLATSTNGTTWTGPVRIPIDAATSTVDHFIPGLGADSTTGGNTARLGLTYYDYTNAACTAATCALNARFISSHDGGATWGQPVLLAGPMSLNWLPNTFSGLMVGDYVATVYVSGKAFSVFAIAQPLNNTLFDEAIYAPPTGLALSDSVRVVKSVETQAVPGAMADHPPRTLREHERQIPGKLPPK